jgi:hypothetical protein
MSRFIVAVEKRRFERKWATGRIAGTGNAKLLIRKFN